MGKCNSSNISRWRFPVLREAVQDWGKDIKKGLWVFFAKIYIVSDRQREQSLATILGSVVLSGGCLAKERVSLCPRNLIYTPLPSLLWPMKR